ncbi:hypothetical protein BX666DRAFT_2016510 [Dichotomocladium elegans]|nr:hypothetical protein BX666DRAFT_2016510 [Dichotomocladium elegans]
MLWITPHPSISVVLPHGRVDPNLSTESNTYKAGPVPPGLCDNQCHGGERRKYVKTQRKKTRLTFFVQRLSTPVHQRVA